MLHYNEGCGGLSLGIAENKLALKRQASPVMHLKETWEMKRTRAEVDAFLE